MKTLINILLGVGIVIAIYIGFLVGKGCTRIDPGEPVTPSVDTLFIPDTNSFTKPEKDTSPDVLIKEIPVPVYVADSSAIDSLLNECARLEKVGDSLRLVLLRVQRHYPDSLYDAWVSGVDPKLDSIKIYQTNMVITKEIPVPQVRHPQFVIGLQAGYGASKEGVSPYIGIGVTYNVMSLFNR